MIPDKLYVNLRILSKVQRNGRISRSLNGVISLEHESYYQALKRFLTQDSRHQAVQEIKSIVDDCITFGRGLINSIHFTNNDPEISEKCHDDLQYLITEMQNARVGIENLRFTYQNDPNTVSQMDIFILKLDDSLKFFDSKLKPVKYTKLLANNSHYKNKQD
jgi:hypothetical protein